MNPVNHAFAVALRARMEERNVSDRGLAQTVGTSYSAVHQWKFAQHLPLIDSGQKIAEALDAPELLTLLVRLRTIPCEQCGKPNIQTSKKSKYCSVECRLLVYKGGSIRPKVDVGRQLAIDAYCRSCEPEGICRMFECPLRAFSPLPFFPVSSASVALPKTTWTPERRAAQSQRIKAAQAAKKAKRAA